MTRKLSFHDCSGCEKIREIAAKAFLYNNEIELQEIVEKAVVLCIEICTSDDAVRVNFEPSTQALKVSKRLSQG